MMNPAETNSAQLAQENRTQADAVPVRSDMERKEHTEFQRTFFLNECTILHDEINARMAQRGNLFTFTIITAGSLLSLGATTNPQIALFYPILSLFLAAAWSDEDGKIGALSTYLHDQEMLYNLSGWETHHRRRKKKARTLFTGVQRFYPKSLLSLATRGVFLSTQLLAILVGVSQTKLFLDSSKVSFSSILPLFCIATGAMVTTIFVIQHKRDHSLVRERQIS